MKGTRTVLRRVQGRNLLFLSDISYNIAKYCKFIAMETLNIRGMLKSNLSRSIHEIGWIKLIEMIKYKAQWYGRQFIPAIPSCFVFYHFD